MPLGTTPEQDARPTSWPRRGDSRPGFAASLELRQYLDSHADTFANSPMTASDLVVAATK
jgi:hypothetical protein